MFIGKTNVEAEAPVLWPLDVKSRLIEKALDAGKNRGRRRRGQHMMRWFDGILKSRDMSLSKLREILEDRGAWHAAVHGVTRSWTWLGE